MQSQQKTTLRLLAAAAAAATAILIIACLLVGPPGSSLGSTRRKSDADFCGQLHGSHGQLCNRFAESLGEQKWLSAQAWRRQAPESFECSGIAAECLHKDMFSNSTGTSCTAAPDGHECGKAGKKCSQGFCGGPPPNLKIDDDTQQQPRAAADSQKQPEQEHVSSGSSSSMSVDDAVPDEEELQKAAAAAKEDEDIMSQLRELYSGNSTTHDADADVDAAVRHLLGMKSMKRMTSMKGMKSMKSMKATQPKLNVKRLNALHSQLQTTVGGWPTARALVNPGKTWTRIQDTFLATSHAYTRIQDYGDSRMAHAWAEIFKMISPAPVLRIGGANQDKMVSVPGEGVFKALQKFRDQTNARFVFGLPLWPKDSVGMSKLLMSRAQKYLGNSVIAYELGNEPEYWPTGIGGWASGKWQPGFDAYLAWFNKVALQINPCGNTKMLSGPGWGNLNTQSADWWGRVMYMGQKCYLKEMNVHYYPYIDNATATPQQLLSQSLLDFGLGKFRDYQRISSKTNLGIRISETNSLYGGGRADLCDTMVGTLWVVDALFTYANAGAKAFHLHWGSGGDPDGEEVQPNVGVMTQYYFDVKPGQRVAPVPWPSVHAPWYGYLFWMLASAGNYGKHADSNFVDAWIDQKNNCDANMKVWSLRSDSGDLRTAFINKSEKKDCNMCVAITDKNYCKKQAIVSRLLPGSEGIYSKGGMTIQGQTYERYNINWDGKILGSPRTQQLPPKWFKDGKCGFCVPVPAASAALVVAKK